ncbi:MAG: hypothetical protein ABI969_09455, partial [bacterium]
VHWLGMLGSTSGHFSASGKRVPPGASAPQRADVLRVVKISTLTADIAAHSRRPPRHPPRHVGRGGC